MGRHLSRGLHGVASVASALGSSVTRGCQPWHRERLITQTQAPHCRPRGMPSQSKAPGIELCVPSASGTDQGIFQRAGEGETGMRRKQLSGCPRQASGGGARTMSFQLLGPGRSKDKGMALSQMCPRGSKEEREHNSNPSEKG